MAQDNRLTLDEANRVVEAALAEGRKLGLKPLCAVLVDAGGHVLALQRPETASNLRPQIATAKATGALDLGVSTRAIATMAAERPAFVGAVAGIAHAGLIPSPGGLLIHRGDGSVIGAVGVTGDTGDNDEICALAGLAAAGLQAKG